MKHRSDPAKRIISSLLAVTTMGFLFSACGSIPHDTPYTFRVPTDAQGERQWKVRTDTRDVVSYEIREADDGQTDVTFTGKKKGQTEATLYLVRENEYEQDAADAYVLTLKVDARRNVKQSEPPYGAYTVRLKGDVTGAEWHVECDEQIVHWKKDREYPKKPSGEDGMQDFTQLYTFTGRRPGATRVRVLTSYPWAEGAESVREDLWLFVDADRRVMPLETTDFKSFRVSEQDTTAQHDVYEAVRTENGVRLSHFLAEYNWSYEADDYVETRLDETVVDGGEALYMYLAGLFRTCGVEKWDGFRKSDPRILDGRMFAFEAELADGTKVTASGSNAFPRHFREFWRGLPYAVCKTSEAAK